MKVSRFRSYLAGVFYCVRSSKPVIGLFVALLTLVLDLVVHKVYNVRSTPTLTCLRIGLRAHDEAGVYASPAPGTDIQRLHPADVSEVSALATFLNAERVGGTVFNNDCSTTVLDLFLYWMSLT